MNDANEPDRNLMDTESPTVKDVLVAARLTVLQCPDHYAKAYAKMIPESLLRYGENGLRSQISYVMANITRWRTGPAMDCKAVFRNWLILNPEE